MGVHSHTVVADVDPTAVWDRWTNVEEWPVDDPGLGKARLNGPLAKGALGWVRRAGERRKHTFRIVEIDRMKLRFVVESKVLLATVRYVRTMERPHPAAESSGSDVLPDPDAWALTHRIIIKGPLARLWDRLVGRRLADELPTVVDNVVAAATQNPAGT